VLPATTAEGPEVPMGRTRALRIAGCIAAALVAGSLSPAAFVVADSAKAERGRYLVQIAGCNDCHTPGYASSQGKVDEQRWLTGDVLGFQGPWGTTYPPNLRRLAASLTVEDWLLAARRPMRPPMPWFVLREMTDQDLAAIYHYIRTLGAAGPIAPAYAPPGQAVATPVVKFPE
ncbi:MAG: c-type cytochrome, partial [Steroidobacteraceae bacterium]